MWLTRLALRNPVFILMMSLMTLLLGAVALQRLPVDMLPDINIPLVTVATFYPGAGPEDIEKSITLPLERAVAAAPGVARVDSDSRQGASVVRVFFDRSINRETAQFEVQQRVNQAMASLPPGIQQPMVMKFDVSNFAIAMLAVTSDELDERQLGELSRNVIEPQLSRVTGVASAAPGGGRAREIQVLVDLDALRARRLDILDVVDSVRRTNLLMPSGNLRAGELSYNVFSNTQIHSARQLRDIIVRPTGSPVGGAAATVRLSDLAQVVDGAADQNDLSRIDGRRGVLVRVMKQPGANTVAVVDALRKVLPSLRDIPPSVRFALTLDQSQYVRSAISSLQHEALWGGALAILVILIFLGSLMATGIVAIAIPLSVVATFAILYFVGETLNVFTLGGLALAIGRLVDDSIVELENIHRHLQTEPDREKAVLAAAQEVAMPILVSTITTVVVFFPVVFLRGVNRDVFQALAITIAFSLAMSFLVSRTVTPLLCLKHLARGGHPANPGVLRRLLDRMDERYAASLSWVLRHRTSAFLLIVVAFATSLTLWPKLGREFMPRTDESRVGVMLRAPTGTRIETTEILVAKIEKKLADLYGPPAGENLLKGAVIRNIAASAGVPTGRGALFNQNPGPHAAMIDLNLVPRSQRNLGDRQIVETLNAQLPELLPGVMTVVNDGGIMRRILRAESPFQVEVEVQGQNLAVGYAYADELLAKLRLLTDAQGRPVLIALRPMYERNYPELHVEVDREKAGVLGVNEQQIAQTVLTSLVGNTQFAPVPFTDPETGYEYFINVRLQDRFRDRVSAIKDLFLRAPSGALVPLSTVADVKRRGGPVSIARRHMDRLLSLTAEVPTYADLGGVSEKVQQVLDTTPRPEGFSSRLGGDVEAQQQMFKDLGFGLLLALALVYMVLASQFKSYLDPLVIMFSVPLGFSGVLLMLYFTGTTFNVNSGMGVIMMIGIVVSNGVLLVDFANVLRRRGGELVDCTVNAARTRLRPILMTSLATVAGLIPMAVGIGEGSETNIGLARAVIGGLTVSTGFTLFLVPMLYVTLERFARRTAHPS